MDPSSRTRPPRHAEPFADPHRACGHDHRLALSQDEGYLADTVAQFLREGLDAGGSAVVVAIETHRRAFAQALTSAGRDVDVLVADGRLVLLDAATTLATFMTAEGPDPNRFKATIGAVLDRATATATPAYVYGEMVAVLWAEGEVAAAIALEGMWNDLAATRDFTLLCAYPMASFDDASVAPASARVSEQHTKEIPAEGFARTSAADEEDCTRAVAELQREVQCLRQALADARGVASPTAGPAARGDRRTVPPSTTMGDCGARFTEALETGDATAATRALEDALGTAGDPAAVYDAVVAVAMHSVGSMWESGRITPADEHLATVVCQRALAALYPSVLPDPSVPRERVLVSGVEGETHALAPRLVADALEARGYDVVHLGTDVPADALGEAAARHRPALVALSMTMASHDPALRRAIAAIHLQFPDLPILLGGQGITPRWSQAGWAVATSASGAIDAVERLLSAGPAQLRLPSVRDGGADAAVRVGTASEPIARVAAELGELARQHARTARSYRALALEDPLTGLANRRAFDDRLGVMTEGDEKGFLFAVDVDGLKGVNDAHGHDAGDALLVEVARAIAGAVRPSDLVARLGGDEFAVLVRDPVGDAHGIAERVRAAVQTRCTAWGTTVSVGGVQLSADRRATVLAADRALYDAKTAGRNAVCVT